MMHGLTNLKIGNTYCTYMASYLQWSPAEIRNPTHCNLIGRSMTASLPLLSTSSILPPPSSNCAFIPSRKNSVPCPKILLFQFSLFGWS